MPPKSKKRRLNDGAAQTSRETTPVTPDINTWPGWCDIESEPAFFNTILHDMGVRGLRVQEVFGIDDTALAILPQPVHALIFLFRYQEDVVKEDQEKASPPHVWFANQVPENACGTVALLNIVNNIPNLELGQQLQCFKDFTESFDPLARGHAIDSFDLVRKIHNSFARDTDMLIVDSAMKEKHTRAMQRQKTEAANASRAAKAAERNAQKATRGQAQPSLRVNPPRRARTTKSTSEDQAAEEAEAAFHFIAYMPIKDHVWKLDGMDKFPTNLGTIPPDSDWLSLVQTTLSVRMAQYDETQMQFSLMAIVQDPLIEARRSLCENIRCIQEVETKLADASPEWHAFIAPESETNLLRGPTAEYDIAAPLLAGVILPDKFKQDLQSGCVESLLKAHQQLVTSQAGHRAAVRDSIQAARSDGEESMHRRHDYGAFVKAWLQALVENGKLAELLDGA